MESSQKILKDFVNRKSTYWNISDGEEATVKFLFAEPSTTHFKGKPIECIRYHVEVNGEEKIWDRPHRELAKQMANFSEGDLISIKRIGEGNKTKYNVIKVNK